MLQYPQLGGRVDKMGRWLLRLQPHSWKKSMKLAILRVQNSLGMSEATGFLGAKSGLVLDFKEPRSRLRPKKGTRESPTPDGRQEPPGQTRLDREGSCGPCHCSWAAPGSGLPGDSQPVVLHHHCGIWFCGVRAGVNVGHLEVKRVEELSWE